MAGDERNSEINIAEGTFDIALSGLFKGPLNSSIAGLAAASDVAVGDTCGSSRFAPMLSARNRGVDCVADAARA